MEKNKKRRKTKNIGTLLLVLWLMSAMLIFSVTAATGDSGSTGQNGFSWSWTRDNEKETAGGSFDASLSEQTLVCNISASSSAYEEAKSDGCGGTTPAVDAAMTTVTATVTNNTGSTIKITGITSEKASAPDLAVNSSLENGKSFTIKLTVQPSDPKAASTTESGKVTITYTVVENVNVTFYGAENLTYTVGEETVSGATDYATVLQNPGLQITLPEVTVSNGTFMGWRVSDGSIKQPGAAVTVNSDSAFYPVGLSGNETYPYTVNGTTYCFWEDAAYAAGTNGLIILNQNYTLPNTMTENGVSPEGGKFVTGTDGAVVYTIPTGVTLLIPYNDENTLCTTKPTIDGTTGTLSAAAKAWKTPSAYCTLNVLSGTKIILNGAMSLSGSMCINQVSNGCPTGPLGFVKMASGSNITVNSGANLYAWGYITGSGSVTVKKGGTVYENFQVKDWRGGTATSKMMNKTQRVFPVSQYYMQNVEVPMTLESGATEYGYFGIVASKCYADAQVYFIGTGGMFRNSGNLVKDYLEDSDYLGVDIYGNLTMSNLVLPVKGPMGVDYNMDSSRYVLPVTSNLKINVKSGATTIGQDMCFLPGSNVTIDNGATINLASGVSLFVYDSDEWIGNKYVYASRDFTQLAYVASKNGAPVTRTLTDAKIAVDGEFNASAGYAYTTTGGANITSNGSGKVITGTAGTAEVTYQYNQDESAFKNVSITPAKLFNLDGTYQETKTANVNYIYTDGFWRCETHTDANTDWICDVCEMILCEHTTTTPAEAKNPSCEEDGVIAHYVCDGCGKAFADADATTALTDEKLKVPATGHKNLTAHDAVASTCVVKGNSAYWECSCGKYFSDAEAKTAVDKDSWVLPLAAHTYGEGVVTTPATCTTDGEKTYTCSVCTEGTEGHTKTEAITKLGHTETDENNDHICDRNGCGVAISTCKDNAAHTAAKDATCKEAGNIEYWTCSVCKKMYSDADCTTEVTDVTIAIDKNNHANIVTDEAVDVTCTTNGKTAGSHCEACDTVIVAQETVAAVGHKYESTVTAPTCTAGGYTTHTCSVCSDRYTSDVTAATSHNAVIDAAVEATCTKTGLTEGSHCGVCGEVIKAQEVVPVKAHTEAAAVVENEVAATCGKAGSYESVVKCATCGNELSRETITVEATGNHNYSAGVMTTPATCKDEGLMTYTCTGCGDTKSETIAKLTTHTEVTDAAVAATCTATGLTEGKHCSVCGTVIVAQQEVAKLDHTPGDAVEESRKEPTCSEVGTYLSVVYCTECNEKLSSELKTIEKLPHTNKTVVTAPTCTEGGYTTYTCTVCGFSEVKDGTDAVGHLHQPVLGKAATCTETGLTDGVSCKTCGAVITAQEEIPALGHKMEETAAAVAPTCEVAGKTAVLTCANGCGKTEGGDEVAKLGHDMKETTAAVAPTCEAAGSTAVYTCANGCGKTEGGDEVAKLGHDMKETTAAVAPTCEAAGSTAVYTCANGCGKTEGGDEVAALGHKWNDGAVTTEPTCTEAGVKTYTCQNDNSHTKTEPVAALQHDLVDVPGKAATCTEDGYTAYKDCSRCDYTEGKETITAAGHSYGKPVFTWNGYDCSAKVVCTCGVEEPVDVEVTSDVTTTATCKVEGIKTYTATAVYDEKTYTDTKTENLGLNAENHNMTAGTVVAPTCVADGYTVYTCSNGCGKTENRDATASLGHKYELTSVDFSADGITYTVTVTCSVCENGVEGHTRTSDARNSTKGTTTDGDCKTNSTTVYSASGKYESVNYDKSITIKGALGDHSYDAVVTEPTCTVDGYTTHTCSICGDSYTDNTVEAKGHTYGEVTYSGDGKTSYTAERICTCSDNQTATAEIKSDVTKPATCTAVGEKTYTADFNVDWAVDKTTTEEIAKLDHTYDKKVATDDYKATDATCTAKATYYYSCECGAKGTDTFESGDMLAHSYAETVAAKYLKSEATCTAKAVYYKSCSVCGEAHASDTFESGDMLTHTYNNQVVAEQYKASDASCTAKATYYYSCKCGEAGSVTFEVGEATGHNYSKPTWEWTGNDAEGYSAATAVFDCTKCDAVQMVNDSEIAEVITDATYDAAGSKVYTASVMFEDEAYTATKTVVIPQLTGYPVAIVNRTTSAALATIKVGDTVVEGSATIGADGKFTVTCEKACVVIVATEVTDDTTGETTTSYVKLPATATKDQNAYEFVASNLSGGEEIIVVLKGDLNMNGDIIAREARYALQASSEMRELTAVEFIIADLDGSGTITAREARYILQASSEMRNLTW